VTDVVADSVEPGQRPTVGAVPAGQPLAGQSVAGRRGRLTPSAVLIVIGSCCVVLGGLVAAATGPLGWVRGSWAAAYLVLVGGVAQYGMGKARAWHHRPQPFRWGWAQIGAWNLGNAAVLGGTLAGTPLVVGLGSALLVFGLVIAWQAARGGTGPVAGRLAALWSRAYQGLLVVLAVSIPIGMVLSL
jgi:hypothetical protein